MKRAIIGANKTSERKANRQTNKQTSYVALCVETAGRGRTSVKKYRQNKHPIYKQFKKKWH